MCWFDDDDGDDLGYGCVYHEVTGGLKGVCLFCVAWRLGLAIGGCIEH